MDSEEFTAGWSAATQSIIEIWSSYKTSDLSAEEINRQFSTFMDTCSLRLAGGSWGDIADVLMLAGETEAAEQFRALEKESN